MSDFGNFIDTVTQNRLLPKVTDNILDGNVLLMRLLSNRRTASGSELLVPIKYQASTTGGSYSGFDTFTTSQDNTRVNATFTPRQTYQNVTLSGIQLGVNSGPEKVLDLMATELNSAADDMADNLGSQLYSDGTTNSNKYMTGLQAAVDDGNSVATYAGLSRSTYTTWVSNLDSSSNTITLLEMAASFDAAQHGNDAPTIGVTTPAIWTRIESLLQASMVYNNPSAPRGRVTRNGVETGGFTGTAGFEAIFFRGRPIVADEKCTSGYFYFLNEKHMWIYTWPFPKEFGYISKPNYNGFAWTGWKKSMNQDAAAGQLLFYGQLVTDSCRSHSFMTGKS